MSKSPRVQKLNEEIEQISNDISELELSLTKDSGNIELESELEEETELSLEEEEDLEESSEDISSQIILKSPAKSKISAKSPISFKSSNSTIKTDPLKPKNKSHSSMDMSRSLFERSVNVMKRRAEIRLEMQAEAEDPYDDYSDIFPISNQLSTYRPKDSPSLKQRFYESTAKRKEFIRNAQKAKEDEEMKECTFSPTKFSNYQISHKSQKIYQRPYEYKQPSQKRTKKSSDTVNNLDNKEFLYRQMRHSRKEKMDEEPPKTVISKGTLKRLTSPKKEIEPEPVNTDTNNQQHFTSDTMYRLLRQNPTKYEISRGQYKRKDDQVSFLTENSRIIVENHKKRDFYEDSIRKSKLDEEQSLERQKYKEAIELHDCTFKPDIKPSKYYKI
ncbi:hypothetical protein TVAG_470320 [Trichomonas vaginalis G3]|uniref:Uncharacterized protein n=1 Tax=Trichomonas vaginalis (strain ATCC PRA-98 / G3) TaxID=412133 RepID=A2G441_TRIV3|nr:hypothetical protein TVAGG3_0238150 [Trichomonas vaginalis G3]EAX88075.1 hypothetical protein TVAG_470320 [Trichomonas vaginalis G3]KAI5553135.1 hypothetical protein TVAGG3_0238150 [Trichomonas vaginalis G3]|eukprot:XP_001301005.1 hypothetical protein [Trichomonas vaginalis G3]